MELCTSAMQGFWEGAMRPICVFQAPAIPPTGTQLCADTAAGRCTNHVQLLPELSLSETAGTGSVKRDENGSAVTFIIHSASSAHKRDRIILRPPQISLHRVVGLKSHLLSPCPEISAKTSMT